MMRSADPHLTALVRTVVEPMGFEAVGVEFHQAGGQGGRGSALLRVYIDHADGITVDDCAAVSHQLSGLLDVEDPIPGHYDLEVSSPGLDRPLFGAEQLRRFTGSRARVTLGTRLDGRRRFDGRLCGIEGDRLRIDVDGERFMLPLDLIESARLVPEF